MAKYRICKVCGKKYAYCPSCVEDMNKPTWMMSFDKAECKEVWDVLSANGVGLIDNKEAVARLKKVNYESLGIADEGMLNHINGLLGKKVEPVKEEKVEVKDTTETKKSEDIKGITEVVKALDKKEDEKESEKKVEKKQKFFGK